MKRMFPSMVCWRVESYSFATNAIVRASADHVGCPGLPRLLVTWRAMLSSVSPDAPMT